MNLTQYRHTQNWFSYRSFYDKINNTHDLKRVLECGVWKGHSIIYLTNLLKDKPNIEIYAIDIWEDWELHRNTPEIAKQIPYIYEIYNTNLKEAGVRELIKDFKGKSWEVAEKFENSYFDLIFIDADHSYEGVYKDLKAWLPKIKPGGILAGHDYYSSEGVQKAVNEVLMNDIVTDGGSNTWMKIIK